MDNVIELRASIDDGRLTIERMDRQPIQIITHEEMEEDFVGVVEYGSTGDLVRAVQSLLNCHGADLDPDGIFGVLTQDALLCFQEQRGLARTGIADFNVLEHLIRR